MEQLPLNNVISELKMDNQDLRVVQPVLLSLELPVFREPLLVPNLQKLVQVRLDFVLVAQLPLDDLPARLMVLP